jgi:DNA-binding MarR family transcriptional regulator
MSDQEQQAFSVDLAEITTSLFANCNEKESRHAAKYGLSAVEFRCIRKLFEKGQLTVNHMAQELSLTSSRVTRIIDGLVEKKLVNRVSGENDRRVFNLSLTLKGERLAQDSIKDHINIHEEIIKNIPEKYRQSMIEILKKLNEAVKNWLEKY